MWTEQTEQDRQTEPGHVEEGEKGEPGAKRPGEPEPRVEAKRPRHRWSQNGWVTQESGKLGEGRPSADPGWRGRVWQALATQRDWQAASALVSIGTSVPSVPGLRPNPCQKEKKVRRC